MKVQSVIINGEEHEFGQGGGVYTAGYNIEISDDNVISTLRQPDHYLGHWNAIQGQSPDFLETAPYEYNGGDYYIVNKTADMSWTNRVEMLGEEYHIPSTNDLEEIYNIITDDGGNSNVVFGNSFNFGDNEGELGYSYILSYGDKSIWTSDGEVVFYNNYAHFSTFSSPYYLNSSVKGIRAMKDEPVIPDNTWTRIYDFSSDTGVSNTGVYKNEILGLITFALSKYDDATSTYSSEISYYTFKDKNEGANVIGGAGNLYQRGNCNPINVQVQNVDFDLNVDFNGVTPSTYSSSTIVALENYQNADDAWGHETDTAIAKRGPCPEGWIVFDNPMMYFMFIYIINNPSKFPSNDIASLASFISENIILNTEKPSDYYSIGSIVQGKVTPVNPTGDSWELIFSEDGEELYYNKSLGLITLGRNDGNTFTPESTIKDKLLGATEIFDPISEYLEKGSITITKSKIGNFYQWGNNYSFDLLGDESIEFIPIIPSSSEIYTEPLIRNQLKDARPYGYNGNIVVTLIFSNEVDNRYIYSENKHLRDYTEAQYNLKPKGTKYVGTPLDDSEIENDRVDINDIYLYDGTQWLLIGNHIVPHVFVTQKEYNAISDKKYSNGTLYLFVDKHPGDPRTCDDLLEYEDFLKISQGIPYDEGMIVDNVQQRAQVICDELNSCREEYRRKFYGNSDRSKDHFIQHSGGFYFGETNLRLELYDASTGFTYYFNSQGDSYERQIYNYSGGSASNV